MQIILTRGISGAGKSSWAKRQDGFFVVSRDEIRSRFCANLNKYFSRIKNDALENHITTIEKAEIAAHIVSGHNLIIDNTNLEPRYIQQYIEIFAEHSVPLDAVSFQDFPSTPARSLARNALAGKRVKIRLIIRQSRLYKVPVKIEDFIKDGQWQKPDQSYLL